MSIFPLSMLSIGEEGELVDIRGGHNLRQRLSAMGLNPGMKVTMIRNNSGGPVILGVMDSKIILGQGMAKKIMVSKN